MADMTNINVVAERAGRRLVPLNTRVLLEQREWLDQRAARNERSVSAELRWMLRHYRVDWDRGAAA